LASHDVTLETKVRIYPTGNHEDRCDRRIRAGGAGRLRMRLQRKKERLHLLGLGLPQRRQDQRDAIRANVGAESARHGGYDKEFEEVIDVRVIAS